MTYATIQNSFSGGEISPSLFGRTDLDKWHSGASTMRNFFSNYRGGASSRAGLRYILACRQSGSGLAPRNIPFQFSINQGYALEFGDNVITTAVTGAASNGGPGLIRLAVASTRGIWSGSTMIVSGVTGTTEANGTWVVTVIDGTHIDLVGSVFTNAYASGGTAIGSSGYMRVISNGAYVVESGQAITGATQANPCVLHIAAHGYAVGDWIFIVGMGGMINFNGLAWIVSTVPDANHVTVTDLFGNIINSTLFSTYTSGGTAERVYTIPAPYAVADLPYLKYTQSADTMSLTCVNQETLFDYPPYDLQRNGGTSWVFTQVAFASSITAPTGLAATARSSTTVDTFYSYVVTAVDANTGEESIASIPVSIENNNISVNAGSNELTWNVVAGAGSYNVYAATPQYGAIVPVGVLYGFLGTSLGVNFVDSNILADFTKVPPIHNDPFSRGTIVAVTPTAAGSGYTQSSIGYTITTTTGSGFVGTPIVSGGVLVGFVIANGGSGYSPADTIAITGGSSFASGTITFTANPANNDTITLNGVTWTFTTGAAGASKTVIQGTLAATLAQLVSDVTASGSASLTVATYLASSTVFTITYKVAGAGGNVYTLVSAQANAVVSGPTLTGGAAGGSATAVLVVGLQDGTYPGCVAYFQQRRVYGYTLNAPDTYFMSQPGAYLNFDASIPTSDGDSITGAPWAQQINGIQFMQPMTAGLIILTGNGAWSLNGGNSAAITPSDQTATSQAYNGCHTHIQPIVVNYDILYVQSKGSIVRDLSYNFFVNIFTGTDTTVLSNHLFNYHQLVQWTYAEEPYKLIWAVRDDGIMLSLTYLKEQNVYSWARHDTNGFFMNVCAVTEPPVDAVYTITRRYIIGQNKWMYYAERMDNRNWQNAEDAFCVDAGLSYPLTYPNATLTPAAAEGTSNISSTLVAYGGTGYTAPTINALDSGGGSGATFSATVVGGVITAITPVAQGQNYVPGSTQIEILDPTGSGAVAQAVITNNVTFTTSSSVFTSANVGDVIRIGNNNAPISTNEGVTNDGGGQAIITSYVSGTQVIANILQPITAVIPNNPQVLPVPAISGYWSLSTPTLSVGGLNHLEGMEVAITADGSVVPNQTVTNGTIFLPQAYSAITVGLPYVCQVQTLYLDPPGQQTIQGKRKNIYNASVRTELSRGIQVGTNQPDQSTQPNYATVPWTNMQEVKERNPLISAGAAIPLFTGDFYINLPASWDEKGQVAVQQIYPLPANILAITTFYQDGDTSG